VVVAVEYLLLGLLDQGKKGRISVKDGSRLVLVKNQLGAVLKQRLEADFLCGNGGSRIHKRNWLTLPLNCGGYGTAYG
jgi:hypothetical protein